MCQDVFLLTEKARLKNDLKQGILLWGKSIKKFLKRRSVVIKKEVPNSFQREKNKRGHIEKIWNQNAITILNSNMES